MNILVTGGLGYIGAHIVVELAMKGYNPVIVDNLSKSSLEVKKQIEMKIKRDITLRVFDIRDEDKLDAVFDDFKINKVIHLAGYKSVRESIIDPVLYYDNNVGSLITLIKVMKRKGCNTLIFSSSSTIYKASNLDLKEEDDKAPCNPYGRSKLQCEEILKDQCIADPGWSVISLRYFNPIGSSVVKDRSKENIMPVLMDVMEGRRERIDIYGDDYDTSDGTCVRDYIHISDVCDAHVISLSFEKKGFNAFNIGTGKGTSVLELVLTFAEIKEKIIPFRITRRRVGDVPHSVCNTDKAEKELKWKAIRSLFDP